ncbi:hypothetical protein AXG93_1864s1070 [Marchantia polymorpha subsp. ruderalis]|uniref:Uncharacterized protein n=1 Tax=Marchantia polymorpha subsp. ruderalis TaxID=1480154 RepID=A0A176WPD0_MARPO|nr:hypothetical protein AXG93_1864s1070 [Marchantia polymorpha subsp. ruderalis]
MAVGSPGDSTLNLNPTVGKASGREKSDVAPGPAVFTRGRSGPRASSRSHTLAALRLSGPRCRSAATGESARIDTVGAVQSSRRGRAQRSATRSAEGIPEWSSSSAELSSAVQQSSPVQSSSVEWRYCAEDSCTALHCEGEHD